jgi:segregation and condensation protein B
MEASEIKHFVEAALLAAGRPLNIDQLKGLFDGRTAPEKAEIRESIATLNEEYEERGIVISEVASGFRMQVKSAMADRLQKLWEERPPRYSRALFETLALIAYRQPITRGDIEEIRGVSVSSNIVRQLLERDWVRVVGHRDVPGRPAMFGTTKGFLDYFGLKKLDDLPPLADLSDWESLRVQLNLPEVEDQAETGVEVANDAAATDLPVLYPEDGDDESAEEFPDEDAVAEALAKAEAVEDIPELQPVVEEPAEEELVVNEWPDPVV